MIWWDTFSRQMMSTFCCPRGDSFCSRTRSELGYDDACTACWRSEGGRSEWDSVALQYTYGRDNFHGPTLGERIERQYADAKSAGVDAEPVGSRWV